MSTISIKILAIVGLGLFLAGCGGRGNGAPPAPTGINTLGAGFVAAFNQGANTTPAVLATITDLAPIDFTIDPFNP